MKLISTKTGKTIEESRHFTLDFSEPEEIMVISTSAFSDPIQPYDYSTINFLDLRIVVAPQLKNLTLNKLTPTDSNFVLNNAKIDSPITSAGEVTHNLAFESDYEQSF